MIPHPPRSPGGVPDDFTCRFRPATCMAMSPLYMTVPILSTLRPLLGIITHPPGVPGPPGRFQMPLSPDDLHGNAPSRILEYSRGFSKIPEDSQGFSRNPLRKPSETLMFLTATPNSHFSSMQPPWSPPGGLMGGPWGPPWGPHGDPLRKPSKTLMFYCIRQGSTHLLLNDYLMTGIAQP